VALLPTTAVANELRNGSLRRIELIGTPRIERRIAALRRLDDEGRTPAAVDFWATLRVFDAEASREDDSMAGRAGSIGRHVDTSTVMERR